MDAHVSRVNILVADMKRSLDFYRLLGFVFPEDSNTQDYIEIKTPQGFRVSWCKQSIIDTLVPDHPPAGHRIELAFRCPGQGGVGTTHARLIEAGYQSLKAPFRAPWGQEYAFVADPDGNMVGLEEYRG